jgi:hypothetical protein
MNKIRTIRDINGIVIMCDLGLYSYKGLISPELFPPQLKHKYVEITNKAIENFNKTLNDSQIINSYFEFENFTLEKNNFIINYELYNDYIALKQLIKIPLIKTVKTIEDFLAEQNYDINELHNKVIDFDVKNKTLTDENLLSKTEIVNLKAEVINLKLEIDKIKVEITELKSKNTSSNLLQQPNQFTFTTQPTVTGLTNNTQTSFNGLTNNTKPSFNGLSNNNQPTFNVPQTNTQLTFQPNNTQISFNGFTNSKQTTSKTVPEIKPFSSLISENKKEIINQPTNNTTATLNALKDAESQHALGF